jgi:pimeloyl-ACP methyl ester carboxylesterase
MTATEWKSQGNYIKYKGHNIFIREAGKGETLILIHGFPTASYDWHKVWNELVRRFHVIAIDMIGFGFSDKPVDYSYSLFDQADLWESILEARNTTYYHILAHDYGDTVAQELLARQLELQEKRAVKMEIRSVCFLNGGIIPREHRPRLIQTLLMSPIGKWVGMLSSKRTLRNNFKAIFGKNTQPSPEEIDDFWLLMTYNNGKDIIHKLIWYMDERRKNKARWIGGMQTFLTPLLMINGPDDPISGRHSAEMFQKLVPQADVKFLEGIGHYPQVEDPLGVLEQFIKLLHS